MTAATSVSPASRTSAYFGCSNDTFATKSVEVTTPSFGKGVLQTFLSSIALANRCPWQCQRPNCGWCRLRMRRKRHSSYLDVREPPRLAKNAVRQSTPAAPSIKAAAKAATVGDATSGNDRYVFDRIDDGRDRTPGRKRNVIHHRRRLPRQRCSTFASLERWPLKRLLKDANPYAERRVWQACCPFSCIRKNAFKRQ